ESKISGIVLEVVQRGQNVVTCGGKGMLRCVAVVDRCHRITARRQVIVERRELRTITALPRSTVNDHYHRLSPRCSQRLIQIEPERLASTGDVDQAALTHWRRSDSTQHVERDQRRLP